MKKSVADNKQQDENKVDEKDDGAGSNSVMISFREDDSLARIDKTKKVDRISNEMIDANLIRYPFFHGFVLQELQLILLKNNGDFLLRLSHQPEKKTSKTGEMNSKSGGPLSNARIILVLSVNISQKVDMTRSVYGDLEEVPKRENIDLHVCIEEVDGKWTEFFVERKQRFGSINEMIVYYKKNAIYHRNMTVFLKRAITLQEWELKGQSVEVTTKKLGEGAYGYVYLGKWKESFMVERKEFHRWCDVAVKTLKNSESRTALSELMHEARLQVQLKHQNVLAVRGIFTLKKPIMLVAEYCEYGSLQGYLKKNRVSVDAKMRFCLGSACGLEHIHFKGLIHRDLATRNILLSSDKTPKIADFGLAKYATSYKMCRVTKIPVRYLAPETLKTFVYSTKSDVYTFGLVIWEIFENGQEPYMKAQPHQEKVVPRNVQLKGSHIKDLIRKELFVKFNPETPANVQQFVSSKLFVADERKRPQMSEVTTFLAGITKMDVSKQRSL